MADRIFWKEPPEDFVRKYKGDDYVRILGAKIKGTDFLDNFIQDLCRKDMKFPMSEKQEKWLRKVEFTFLKELDAKSKVDPDVGIEHALDLPDDEGIPF